MTVSSDTVQSDSASPTNIAPEIDVAKVERLKRAIESGHYVVDQDLIAAKMVDQGFPPRD